MTAAAAHCNKKLLSALGVIILDND